MPRPRLIQEDTRVYNLVLGESVFGQLHQMAFDQSREEGKMISVAQLIREAIARYLDETDTRR